MHLMLGRILDHRIVWILAGGLILTIAPSAHAAGAVAKSPSGPGIAPLPRSNYAVHQVCPAPAPGTASCLAMHLVPTTSAARARTHPLGMTRRKPISAASAAEGAFGLRPQDLHSAYGLPSEPTAGSAPQTIAIVDAYDDPTAESDLKVYDEEFHLPACTTANGCFTKLNQEGKVAPLPATNGSWALEIALDIETAHAVCQSCHILLLEASSSSYEALEAAEQRAAEERATEISNSWGGPEPGGDSPAFNHPGLVITASAGDDGYLNWDAPRPGERGFVDYPASSPHVIGVGGTHLRVEAGAWKEETVWNQANNGSGAGGGGCSGVFGAQPWQQELPDWMNVGCGSRRAVADVAADADPYTGAAIYDSTPLEGATLKWTTIGGTSLASPIIASTFALAGGADGVGYPAQTLYTHSGLSSLHDVLSGTNGGCTRFNPSTGYSECTLAEEEAYCSHTLICNAAGGYDGPTGVGTPNGISAFEPGFPAGAARGFLVNGRPAAAKENPSLVLFGTMTLENAAFGKASCRALGGGSIWNEGPEGRAVIEAFTSSDCSAPSCPGLFVSAEKPPELVESVVETEKRKETERVARRGASALPWPAALLEPTLAREPGELRFIINALELTVVAPCAGAEFSFEGSLEPTLLNGVGNGLTPSRLLYTTESGRLISRALPPENDGNVLLLNGQIQIWGAQEQLLSGK
jgi:hypothetical protein